MPLLTDLDKDYDPDEAGVTAWASAVAARPGPEAAVEIVIAECRPDHRTAREAIEAHSSVS